MRVDEHIALTLLYDILSPDLRLKDVRLEVDPGYILITLPGGARFIVRLKSDLPEKGKKQ